MGETIDGYQSPGILDGMGAYALDADTVRVLVNHELVSTAGYAYQLANGTSLTGGRVSFFDINKDTFEIEDSGLAYDTIYNRAGEVVDAAADLEFSGLNRFCSATYVEANQFGTGLGLYVGEKNYEGDGSFLDRNGLAYGKLYVWAADNGNTTTETLIGPMMVRSISKKSALSLDLVLLLGKKLPFGSWIRLVAI